MRVLGILILALLSFACGRSGDGEGDAAAGAKPHSQVTIAAGSNAAADQLIQDAQVTCADFSSCPDALGYVLSKIKTDAGIEVVQCTGFLIDAQTLITNSHCLDRVLRVEGSDCSGAIDILFPQTPTQAKFTRVSCERVLSATQISSQASEHLDQADYAVLKLKESLPARKPFQISREGIPDGLQLTNYAVDPSSETRAVGKIVKRHCKSIHNSSVVPLATDQFAPVGAVSDCDLNQGNSGSPLVDSLGSVRGIVFADSKSRPAQMLFGQSPIDATDFVSVTAVANAVCFNLPGINVDARCDLERKSTWQLALEKIPSSEFETRFLRWQEQSTTHLRFTRERMTESELDSKLGLFYEQPQLLCAQNLSDWSKDTDGSLWARTEIPRFGFEVRFDKYQRPALRVKLAAVYTLDVKVRSNGLSMLTAVQTLHSNGLFDGIGERSEIALPICEN